MNTNASTAAKKLAQNTSEKKLGVLTAAAKYSTNPEPRLRKLRLAEHMLKASISVEDPKGIIFKAFVPEDRTIKGKSEYKTIRTKNLTKFEISASDSGSLRTVMNSITKMLTVIEKMERIK